jgi:hypothetical protein
MNTTAYTTKADVEAYIGKALTQSDSVISSWIQAASRWADAFCNRDLYNDEETTELYDGDGTDFIMIRDTCEITSVIVDGVAVSPKMYPTSKDYRSRLVLDNGYTFTKGLQNVAVTGKVSMFEALPDVVKLACTVIVAGIQNAGGVQGKVGTTETIGNYSVTYRDAAQKTDFDTAKANLSAFRRIAL